MKRNTLWKVPLYCIIAGIIAFFLEMYLLSHFAVITLPDGTVTNDAVRTLVIYGIIFIAAVLIGGLVFFRKMTQKEIFLSATIVVVIQMIILLIETIAGSALNTISIYLSIFSQWSSFISQLILKITNHIWPAVIIKSLIPYIFVFFGKKE